MKTFEVDDILGNDKILVESLKSSYIDIVYDMAEGYSLDLHDYAKLMPALETVLKYYMTETAAKKFIKGVWKDVKADSTL